MKGNKKQILRKLKNKLKWWGVKVTRDASQGELYAMWAGDDLRGSYRIKRNTVHITIKKRSALVNWDFVKTVIDDL